MLKARVNIPIQQTFLNIDALELPIRIQNSLKAENIYSIQKLIAYSENDLLKTPNLGRQAIAHIKHKLAILNLRLKENNGTT
jgi:DNA-directed RNA polymerase alpha subunit